jgi:hypothetical protein
MMRRMSSDEQINALIDELEAERETLRGREGAEDPQQEQDAQRLEEIRIELDRLWDLLRQRRALRNAGRDPDQAQERPESTVEGYLQ